MPDLNFRSPDVVKAIKDVLTFWMDRGVDGFRVDAAPHIFEHDDFLDEPFSGDLQAKPYEYSFLDHIYTRDLPETLDIIYEFRDFVDEYSRTHGRDTM